MHPKFAPLACRPNIAQSAAQPATFVANALESLEKKSPDVNRGAFSNGSRCWTRTSDPLINSQLLYQLS
jgi:hypothetical protein